LETVSNEIKDLRAGSVELEEQGCIDHDADGAQRVIGWHEIV
jgi:hypothetical protein